MFHVIPDILYPADIVPPINQLLVIPDMSDQLLYLFSRTTRLFLVIPDMLFSRAMFLVIPDMLFSRTTHLFLVIPDMLYPAGIFSHGQLTRFSSSRTCLISKRIFSHEQLDCFFYHLGHTYLPDISPVSRHPGHAVPSWSVSSRTPHWLPRWTGYSCPGSGKQKLRPIV